MQQKLFIFSHFTYISAVFFRTRHEMLRVLFFYTYNHNQIYLSTLNLIIHFTYLLLQCPDSFNLKSDTDANLNKVTMNNAVKVWSEINNKSDRLGVYSLGSSSERQYFNWQCTSWCFNFSFCSKYWCHCAMAVDR